MESPEVILRMKELVLGYGQHLVLRRVNLEVRAGERWFVLGPNGSGKTTLLRAVLGLVRPHAGELWLHPELARRERIGFVPQRHDLLSSIPMTVREFVLLGLVGTAVGKREAAPRLAWALETMGLQECARQSYWTLSGGQRQRALVARALIRRPSMLVLDEPTSGLDMATEETLLRLLTATSHSAPCTVLFVTHSLALAMRYATHAALVLEGHVIAGPQQTVLTPNNLVRLARRDTDGLHPLDTFPLLLSLPTESRCDP
ncbi:MAG: ATP-binding cassette domain-containing protein [Candidatus Binatia bacterium]|nr:ATP-binding cassette domain-containing protein [Candidatus Binatia bacterium]